MKLVITIDTEEDNWGEYDLSSYSLDNIKRIDRLQELFDRFAVTPTYLVTYPVATNIVAASLLKRIMEDGRCDIGAHCHPWNTPPFDEKRNDFNSMLCNLPAKLQQRKIAALHEAISDSFGMIPKSFRAGRWGLGKETPHLLSQLDYRVDTSVMAFQNWEIYGGPDHSEYFPSPFVWDESLKIREGSLSRLVELPATSGFLKGNFALCEKVWQTLGKESFQRLHLKCLLARTGILNKIWLSPETTSSSQMIGLTKTMMRKGYKIFNMFFHSTALKAGLNSFVQTRADEDRFLQKIEEYLVFARNAGIESIKLSEAPEYAYREGMLNPFRSATRLHRPPEPPIQERPESN